MNLRIERFVLGAIQENAYALFDDAHKEAVVIDPGADPEPLIEAVRGYRVAYLLLTHAHFDHIAGLEALKKATGAPILIHPQEAGWLRDPELNGSAFFPDLTARVVAPNADRPVEDGDVFPFARRTLKVLHVPGHSPGSVAYLIDEVVFTGDALFAGGIGRTDLPGGDHAALLRSVREKLYPLPPETRVYPGHGPETTIGRERTSNPFVRG
ncbi:MBL fold metallo-hydrolase [Hydrogenibacillus schlegelii]|uniref:Metal-binding protein n=1 Tax=Hydrogenibacillus schlegelii TaxID=1484 RepID=A0A132MGU2_HYDSH|nr:MBL fold metallo-hydrolase [Hydrogenibacillus schlegelii]KWW97070.1 metal-binding protein [Hydrogenibacillus schlegelii]OAR03396.1 metal-binding protein [Hydrogenibacillus schlegelii]